ncbi:MAG: M20/M25/M40 family metallo-hydrolase, partial [Anaerovoracaceae bacterium]
MEMRNSIMGEKQKELYGLFENCKPELLKDVKDLLKIPSVSEERWEVSRALDLFMTLAKSFDLETSLHADNEVGLVEYGEGEETFGLLVHLDVVSGDQREWDTAVYDLTQKDGKLIGRGIVDDKGPAVMMLYIMKFLKQQNIKTKRKVQMIVGTREEISWTDMETYTKTAKLPDFGFTPDGEFPIQNAEKGYADVVLYFPKENIASISSGSTANSIPAHC